MTVSFINISVILWWTVLMVEESGEPGEIRSPATLKSRELLYHTNCSQYTLPDRHE